MFGWSEWAPAVGPRLMFIGDPAGTNSCVSGTRFATFRRGLLQVHNFNRWTLPVEATNLHHLEEGLKPSQVSFPFIEAIVTDMPYVTGTADLRPASAVLMMDSQRVVVRRSVRLCLLSIQFDLTL